MLIEIYGVLFLLNYSSDNGDRHKLMHAPDYYQNLDLEGKNDILVICLNVHKKLFLKAFYRQNLAIKKFFNIFIWKHCTRNVLPMIEHFVYNIYFT